MLVSLLTVFIFTCLILMFVGVFKPSLLIRLGRMKIQSTTFIIACGLVIVLVICSGMVGIKDTISTYPIKTQVLQKPEDSIKPIKRIDENFVWIEKPIPDNGAIVGKLKNTSDNQFNFVSIEFIILDDDGNKLDAVNQYINNLGPGNTWSFAIPVNQKNAAGFKFLGVTAR